MPSARSTFVFAICGNAHVDRVNTALKFLRRFARSDILVVAARVSEPVDHDQVAVCHPPAHLSDRQAAVWLKSGLHKFVDLRKGPYCHLDSDVIAVSHAVDDVFNGPRQKIAFAADHVRIGRFSMFAVNCGCTDMECVHLCTAIKAKFGVRVADSDWAHWNGGVFVFDARSVAFLDTWHAYSCAIFDDPYWQARDQGTLIAAAWKHGLSRAPVLDRKFNHIVDGLFGVPYSARAGVQPWQIPVNRSYDLEDAANRPAFLHFISGFGAVGWKNWDDLQSLVA